MSRLVAVVWFQLMLLLFLLSPLAHAQQMGPHFDRAPYLQQLTATSVIVVSQTAKEAVATLRYGLCDGDERVVLDTTVGHGHVFRLEELKSDSNYCYELVQEERKFASAFRTLPENDGEVTFAVLGDSGLGGDEQRGIAEVLRDIGPDIILHTGDLAYPAGHSILYQLYLFEVYADLLARASLYPVPGNHDCSPDISFYRDTFFLPDTGPLDELNYSFDAGAAHCVALTTCGSNEELPGWLEEDLAATDKPWKIVYFHHPPYSNGEHGPQPWVRDTLVPILEQFEVDLVFSGHEHSYERFYPIRENRVRSGYQDPLFGNPDGVIYVVTGGGGGILDDPRSEDSPSTDRHLSAIFKLAHHAVSLRVTRDKLEIEAIGLDKESIDRFVIMKEPRNLTHTYRIGDANESGSLNAADAVAILWYIFLGSGDVCDASSDVNRDDTVDQSDAVGILAHLFLGAPNPEWRIGACRSDSESDKAGCVANSCD